MATELVNLWHKAIECLDEWEMQRPVSRPAEECLLAAIAYALLAQRETWMPVEKDDD